ncbi:calcium-binding protein [Ruegeria sp. 2205SS24-7]|uniref:calcium-binding protein n=1 Tax=Ruegeria discodermiae TaxID=3064389 RepID=UPI0027425D19|nr:calcium-binding protein [Ruegeria sp. 2205SS24-7]MDP5220818.1 calcium-binding protein [Ruegeria sp. 2205SS24-7]
MTEYTLNGTSGQDILKAVLPGSHYIHAGSGNDVVYGSNFGDLIYGYYGDDAIFTGTGDDTVYGGGGNDNIYISAGDDYIHGGAGIDSISLDNAEDGVTVDMNKGTARSTIGDRANIGDNTINYVENVFGSDYKDIIYGNYRDNAVYGGGGNDHLQLGAGNDKGFGGDGYDTFIEGTGNDFYHGGAGFDMLLLDHYSPTDGKGAWLDTNEGTLRTYSSDLDIGFNRFESIERFDLTHGDDMVNSLDITRQAINLEGGDDYVTVGFNDSIDGGAGRDTIDLEGVFGIFDRYELKEGKAYSGDLARLDFKNVEVFLGAESDETFRIAYKDDLTVYANGGEDSFIASGQNLLLSGGDDDDMFSLHNATGDFYGGDGNDEFHVSNASGAIFGGDGRDDVYVTDPGMSHGSLFVQNADVYLQSETSGYYVRLIDDASDMGRDFNQVHVSTLGTPMVTGTAMDDVFDGTGATTGRIRVFAGDGDDIIVGTAKNDLLRGDGGDDYLTGGGGRDSFQFTDNVSSFGRDTITDFVAGPDNSTTDRLRFDKVRELETHKVIRSFDQLDSNDDGIITGADDNVKISGDDMFMYLEAGTIVLENVDTLYEDNFFILG